MPALVMILTAAIAIPGDAPEKVSGEVSEKERGLDLKGKWEGSLRIDSDFTVPATYQDSKLTAIRPGGPETASLKFIDEGGGKFRCRFAGDDKDALGIYRWNKKQLVLCIGKHWQRPSSFRAKDVLILTIQRVEFRN